MCWHSERPGINRFIISDTRHSDTSILNPPGQNKLCSLSQIAIRKVTRSALLLKAHELPVPRQFPDPLFLKLFRSPPATRRRWSPRWIIYTWPLSLRGSQGRRCYRRRVINLFWFSLSVVISSVWLPVDVQSASPATIMNRCEGRGCWPASRLHIAVILSLPSHSLVLTRGKFIRSELPVTSMQGLEIAVGCGHTNTAKQ